MQSPARILVADDDADIILALELLLQQAGYQVLTASTPAQVLQFAAIKPDLVLLDMNFCSDTTSGHDGLQLLPALKQLELSVILMTAWASIDLAVQAMQQGADYFLQKPWHNSTLLQLIADRLELRRLRQRQWQQQQLAQQDRSAWVANSEVMQRLEKQLSRIAGSDANVLILGESGVGKSALAARIHQLSARDSGAFVSVNMAAIPQQLFEAELFGHEKGAFTDAKHKRTGRFALADGGTLFLDEIGCLPAELQPKLLRVLETGWFEPVGASKSQRSDARIISATNSELSSDQFRPDLLFRLNTLVIEIPPLRARPQDIPALVQQLLPALCRKHHRPQLQLSPSAWQQLQDYAWPGNVRELQHVLERAVVLAEQTELHSSDLALQPSPPQPPSDLATPLAPMGLPPFDLQWHQQQLINAALQAAEGQQAEAARLLGISRFALARRLEKS